MGGTSGSGIADLIEMTAETLTPRTRKKRTILYGGARLSPGAKLLQELSTEVRASLVACETYAAFRAALESEKEAVCLVVLASSFPDHLVASRAASQSAPLSELVLLADTELEAAKQRLPLVSGMGRQWQVLSSDLPGIGKILRSTYQRADQRRATRTTLDRFNASLSMPAAAVDTQELRKLVISDRFLSSILESAFDAVILTDRYGTIVGFNPSAERMFGCTQREALSHPVAAIAQGKWPADVQRIVDSRQHGELVLTSFSNQYGTRQVEIAATAVYDRSQNQLATSLIVRDVTERMQSEDALRTSEKLAAVGRLASSIAHEINNPLEAVGNLIYLARQAAESVEVQEYLDLADQELRRVSVITAQTLGFHKQALDAQPVDPDALLETVLQVYRGRFAASHIAIERRMRARRPVCCFEGEIRQVLNNLVGNALDEMRVTGGRLLLRTREATNWKTMEQGMMLTIADTGSGMTPMTRKRLFEAFYTTKGTAGTGLGLWISHEIVVRHRGNLRVWSSQRPGRSGTVFNVFLPFDAVRC